MGIELARDWWNMVWLVRKDHFVAQILDVLAAMLDARKRLDGRNPLSMACHEGYVYIVQPTSKLLLRSRYSLELSWQSTTLFVPTARDIGPSLPSSGSGPNVCHVSVLCFGQELP